MTRGLVFGKFYPPHAGHHHLIRTAQAGCDALTVLVLANPRETIGGELRARWLREAHPDARVLHVRDDGPQSWPEEDEDAWRAFVALVRARHPEPVDVLFTSEWYGEPTARRLGARHVAVDPQRTTFPVSGTAVRANPLAHLHHLTPAVRAHLVPRVAIVGAESTGKTTLAAALARELGTVWVPEYGREFCEARGHTYRSPIALRSEDFVAIAREQNAREDAAAATAPGILICDTCALATSIWHERYLGARSEDVRALVRDPALYLLALDDLPFVQDGTRDGEHLRGWMTRRFRAELLARGVSFAEISGAGEARTAAALRALAPLLR
ncbi:MAG: putative NadR-like transcriptional regulator [Candidatus Eremiobacteraeota bacterium]|nr:putative NadR-like transcriptional regulator [Candidatus Eremiobacteraeota bacterium]